MKKSKMLYISMSRQEKILGWLYMAFSLLALPALLSWVNKQLADPIPESTLNFVFYLTNFLFITGIFHRFHGFQRIRFPQCPQRKHLQRNRNILHIKLLFIAE